MGSDRWLVEGQLWPKPEGVASAQPEGIKGSMLHPGVSDAHARLKDMDSEGIEIAVLFGNLPEHLAAYGFDDLVLTWRKTYDVACNWTVYFENLRDQLHIGTVHRASFNRTVPVGRIDQVLLESTGQYSAAYIGAPTSTGLMAGDSGFPTIKTLAGKHREGSITPLVYPGIYFSCTLDCVFYIMAHPLDARRTRVEVGVTLPSETVERPDFDEVAERYYKTFVTVMGEDNTVLERQQRGLDSPFTQPGRFSHREEGVHRVCRWVIERVLDGERLLVE